MSEPEKILIITRASSKLGFGHLKRCLHLAEELEKAGMRVVFSSLEKDLVSNVALTRGFGYDSVLHQSEEIERLTTNKIDASYSLVLFDLLNKDLSMFEFDNDKLKTGFIYTFKPQTIYNNPEFIIFPSIQEMEVNEINKLKNKVAVYSGVQYIILDRYFAERKIEERSLNRLENVLITMGGSDPLDLTSKLIKCFQYINRDLTLQIVAGPGYKYFDGLRKLTEKSIHKCNIYHDPPNMIEIMEEANIAFAPGGTTRFELCALGIPFVLLAFNTKQESNNAAFVDKYNIGFNLGLGEKIDSKKISNLIDAIDNNKNSIGQMSLRAQKIIDGKGLFRCKEIILNHL